MGTRACVFSWIKHGLTMYVKSALSMRLVCMLKVIPNNEVNWLIRCHLKQYDQSKRRLLVLNSWDVKSKSFNSSKLSSNKRLRAYFLYYSSLSFCTNSVKCLKDCQNIGPGSFHPDSGQKKAERLKLFEPPQSHHDCSTGCSATHCFLSCLNDFCSSRPQRIELSSQQ